MKKYQKLPSAVKLDALAIKLIEELQNHGRKSFRELARELNVSEGTIRKRVQSLTNQGIIQITAKINLQKLGLESICIMALTVNMRELETVANYLLKHPNVYEVFFVTGRYDIVVTLLFHNPLELSSFVKDHLSEMNGIQRAETFVITEFKKASWKDKIDINAISQISNDTNK